MNTVITVLVTLAVVIVVGTVLIAILNTVSEGYSH